MTSCENQQLPTNLGYPFGGVQLSGGAPKHIFPFESLFKLPENFTHNNSKWFVGQILSVEMTKSSLEPWTELLYWVTTGQNWLGKQISLLKVVHHWTIDKTRSTSPSYRWYASDKTYLVLHCGRVNAIHSCWQIWQTVKWKWFQVRNKNWFNKICPLRISSPTILISCWIAFW